MRVCNRRIVIGASVPTQAWREQLGVQVRNELLRVGVELAHPGDNVAGQTDAYDLHDSLEDEEREVGEVWMGAVRRALVLEGVEEAIAGAVRAGRHDGEVAGGSEVAKTQRLDGTIEDRHGELTPASVGDVTDAEGHGST